MTRGNRLAGTVLMFAAALSCSSDPDDGRCQEQLTFSITAGITPTFSWAPECGVAQLRVTRDEDDAEIWAFVASSNSVTGPVTYGQAPAGTTVTNPHETLTFDDAYTVRVAVLDPDTGLLIVAGTAGFTPAL